MGRYRRVMPRDLFNEAALLADLGRLHIALETDQDRTSARFLDDAVERFEVGQDASDGSIEVENVRFDVAGRAVRLSRPLNSRSRRALQATWRDDPDAELVDVFDDAGGLWAEMRAMMRTS